MSARSTFTRLAIALLGSTMLAGEVRADTLTVPSEAFPTIQSAVDAAQDGDIVLIAPGLYSESVTVTTNGISLIAKGSVRLVGTAAGAALRLAGNDISVQKLRITGSQGAGVRITGSGALLFRCRIQDVPGNAVELAGANAWIERSLILRPGLNGGLIGSDGNTWVRTRIVDAGVNGILESLDGPVAGNRYERLGIVRAGDRGMRLTGSASHVHHSRIARAADDGIRAHGSINVIEWNRIVRCGNDGIEMDGDLAVVHGNRVLKSGADGIELDGNEGSYSSNRVLGSTESGFQLSEGIDNVLSFNVAKGSGDFDPKDDVGGMNIVEDNNKFKTTGP